MRTLRFAAFAAVSALFAPALVLVACGGDDPPGGGTHDSGVLFPVDSANDTSNDVTVQDHDASPDDAQFDTASDAVTDADAANAHDANDGDSADALLGPPPGPPVCGDGWRDEATEECDNGGAGETCAATCRVLDIAIAAPASSAAADASSPEASAPDAANVQRTLASGAHAVSAHDTDFAAAVTATDSGIVALALHAFTARGARLHVTPFSAGSTPLETSNPVIAALPNGRYAAAWTDTDGDGDGQGVALRSIDPNAGTFGPLLHANTTTLVTQHAPDMVWTGSALVVAWADDSNLANGADLKMRTFDRNLTQVTGETSLAATTDVEANVSLCAFEGAWAAAWRSFANGDETVRAKTSSGIQWSIGPIAPGPADAVPSLLKLDATHLAMAYTEGTNTSQAGTTRIRLVVLDTNAPAATPVGVWPPSVIEQSSPRLARVGNRSFIVWWTAASAGDANGEDVSLAEIVWPSAQGASLDIRPAMTLPRTHWTGDQRSPALATMNGASNGSLVSAWDDLGRSIGPFQSNHDVVAEVIPIPMLRLESDGGP